MKSIRFTDFKEALFLLLILFVGFFLGVNLINPAVGVDTFGYGVSVVSSDSMKPVFETGDLIVVEKVDANQIDPGDIIAFTPNNEMYVAHYLADIRQSEDGDIVFKTRSYTAEEPKDWDYWGLQADQIVGKYKFKIPNVGHFTLFIKTPQGLISILALFAGIFVFDRLREE